MKNGINIKISGSIPASVVCLLLSLLSFVLLLRDGHKYIAAAVLVYVVCDIVMVVRDYLIE